MKKFIKPEVKVLMVDMTINCMSGGTGGSTDFGGQDDGQGTVIDAPTRGIFD